jgi:hypothetical protein
MDSDRSTHRAHRRHAHHDRRPCPPNDPADDDTDPVNPPDDPADDDTDPVNPPDDPADGDTDPVNPPDDPADGDTDPVNPPDDPADGDTDPVNPPDDPADDITPLASGTLTVSGTGFGGSAGRLIGLLSLPADTPMDASLVNQLVDSVEGVMAGLIQANGSIANIISPSQPLTLLDLSFSSHAIISGGEHLVVALIDNAPSVTDFTGFSDIGANDMVAFTTVVVDGDTSLNIDYNALIWTAFGDL